MIKPFSHYVYFSRARGNYKISPQNRRIMWCTRTNREIVNTIKASRETFIYEQLMNKQIVPFLLFTISDRVFISRLLSSLRCFIAFEAWCVFFGFFVFKYIPAAHNEVVVKCLALYWANKIYPLWLLNYVAFLYVSRLSCSQESQGLSNYLLIG